MGQSREVIENQQLLIREHQPINEFLNIQKSFRFNVLEPFVSDGQQPATISKIAICDSCVCWRASSDPRSLACSWQAIYESNESKVFGINKLRGTLDLN